MKTTKKHAIWFHCLYIVQHMICVCVGGGGHINIFSGGPQSSSYGPDPGLNCSVYQQYTAVTSEKHEFSSENHNKAGKVESWRDRDKKEI